MKTEIKRQKRRTPQHRKRRNQGDENTIRAWSPKNVNSRTRGSADWLPIEDLEVIAEYLKYPNRGFLVDFRMHRGSFWVLVDWVESNRGGR